MTTFLQLCRRTREKCGISGSGPTTVVNQVGEMARLVNWVAEAWEDIQIDQNDWDWMRNSCTVQTIANQQAYTATDFGITDLSTWREDSFRVYKTSDGIAGEQHLNPVPYSQFRDTFMFGTRITGRPYCFSVRPSDSAILLGPIPPDICTVVGEYQRTPATMTLDADVPTIPAEYSMLIVYGAMKKYAGYEAAQEVMATAEMGYKHLMSRMVWRQTPGIEVGETLA